MAQSDRLFVEQFGRINLTSFSIDCVAHVIHHAIFVGLLLQLSVIEPTGRISVVSFSNLQFHARDQSCCLRGVVFVTFLT